MIANTLHFSNHDTEVINAFRQQLNGSPARVSSKDGHEAPDALTQILNSVIQAVAEGKAIRITQIPKQVTTTTAAALLGVSRPTVMKYIQQGKLTASKVGSHHRLDTAEVLSLQQQRKQELRNSVFEILDLENSTSLD